MATFTVTPRVSLGWVIVTGNKDTAVLRSVWAGLLSPVTRTQLFLDANLMQ